jgi:DNA-binding NtrC family response regulator
MENGTLIVGSGTGADLVLQDKGVSRMHVELALMAEGVRVRDLGSTNGTFVGDARIEAVTLRPPAEIRIGRTRIELLSADVPAPELASERTRFGALVGASAAMRKLFGILERVTSTDTPLLIEGEPGTGKTEAALAVHRASHRAQGPLVVIDIESIAARGALLEMIARGAGGTAVLERIEAAPAWLAAELVAVCEKRERGELDVRPIATSRADLRELVGEGSFRRDLYFHLAGVRVVVPPLRERREDLGMLVRDIAGQMIKDPMQLADAELATAMSHDFPGNVRELRRVIEKALLMSAHAAEPDAPIPWSSDSEELAALPFKEAKDRLLDAFERQYVQRLLQRHDGNVSRAAQEAGLGRNHLTALAKKHGLK